MSHFEIDQFVICWFQQSIGISRKYIWGSTNELSHFEMDGDVKSTRHRSISQDCGYNFNLIWVWFTGLHTPSFLLHMIIINIKNIDLDWKIYRGFLWDTQRDLKPFFFVVVMLSSSCVNKSLYLLYLSLNFFLIVGRFLHLSLYFFSPIFGGAISIFYQ